MFTETKDAIAASGLSANVLWKDYALSAIFNVARVRTEFTSADVYEEMSKYISAPQTHENRAMGPVMLHAAKKGWMSSTDRYKVDIIRPWCHDQPRRIWKSNLIKMG